MIDVAIERWLSYVHGGDPAALDALLADDVEFYSPIVFTPQRGKAITALYLAAAAQALPGDAGGRSERAGGDESAHARPGRFRYTKKVLATDVAVLEFETTVEGKYVNGVDIIRVNEQGLIVEFRVMIRPLQAVNAVHAQMKAMLEKLSAREAPTGGESRV